MYASYYLRHLSKRLKLPMLSVTQLEFEWLLSPQLSSDAGGENDPLACGSLCLTQAAQDQAHRAVQELLTDVIRLEFRYPWPERT